VGRPAYAVSCGGYRLVDWLARLGQSLRGVTRPHLLDIQRLDYPQFRSTNDPASSTLLVNARLVPSRDTHDVLAELVREGRPSVIWKGDQLAAAVVARGFTAEELSALSGNLLKELPLTDIPPLDRSLQLLEYPHDVVGWNLKTLSANLEHRLATGDYREVRDGVYVGDGAELGEYVVSDTRHGPIVLERGARIGPYCFLSGPAHLGAHARVIEHSAIKDCVSLGHTTKIGGEVEASVIEPYTNKQHHGFLGHSYLGSWINLGAGTCNSDLKNTYGFVKMEYGGEKVSTGMQFVGCIMGDYAKSAINTGIFTGKIIGACSMVYGFVTTNVPSFVNYARLFGQVTELPPEVMIATQERMFVRRDVKPRACDAQLIRAMYELTRDERQLAGEPLSL
jgi:glucose-1-phosphate thymidylyltransferase